jgi:hypothetical protein
MRRGRVGLLVPAVVSQWLLAGAVALGAAPPAVPESLKVPAGEQLLLQGHATGAQIYSCQASGGAAPAWTLKAPDAELRDDKGTVIIRHFAGPTWRHQDGSEVTGKAVAHADAPGGTSVPWLLLTATGHSGAGILSRVTSVQRLNTQGGQAPATGCDATKIGTEVRSPYSADYYFYAPSR